MKKSLSRCKLEVKSTNLRAINRLIRLGIPINNMTRTDNNITAYISRGDIERTKEELDSLDVCYEIDDMPFWTRIYHTIVDRIGLVIGAIFILMLLVIMSMSVLTVSVHGNDKTPTSDIIDAVKEVGMVRCAKKKVDKKLLSDTIMTHCPSIAVVSIEVKGIRLNITVKEQLLPPVYYRDENGAIIAKNDGIITRMMTLSGTPLVDVGDSVRAGDVLIAPYKIIDDEMREEVEARGEVYARCYVGEDIAIGEENISFVPTGKSKCMHSIVRKKRRTPYEYYSASEQTRHLYSLIPFKMRGCTYYEEKQIIHRADDEKWREQLIDEAYETINSRLNNGEKPLNRWFFEKRLDNVHIISVYYEVEKLISGGTLEQTGVRD